MKHLCLFMAICLWTQATKGQDTNVGTQNLYQKADAFGKGFPQEKVFLHLDNTCYFVGDTIWYKGYVTRSDRSRLSDLSKILYVELLSPDGYLVERQQLEMPDGTAHGAFVLTDSLYSGYYELRAYTRWMLNFGCYEHAHSSWSEEMFYDKKMARAFFRDYEKLYSRVFPVYDQPDSAGHYLKDMTTRPSRRYFHKDKGKPEIDVRFYPEGGNLVSGTPSRVAFEAKTSEGEYIDITLSVRNAEGSEVAQGRTLHRGRGMFVLPDIKAEGKYTAAFTYNGHNYEVDLPHPDREGFALCAEQQDSTLHISLRRGGSALPEEELGLHIMHQGISTAFYTVRFDENGKAERRIPLTQLPTGVNQITLFDNTGKIHADRLFFINHGEYETPCLDVTGIKRIYKPFEPITLQLKWNHKASPATPPAHLSIAVRDRATDEQTYDNGNILTEMLLCSELKGFVENPGYYFEKNDSVHRRDLDLLMMVQGWRRYSWREMAGVEPFVFSALPEKGQTLAGSVYNTYSLYTDNLYGDSVMIDAVAPYPISYYTSVQPGHSLQDLYSNFIKDMTKEVNVVASYAQDGETVDLMQETRNGKFYMESPKFYEDCFLFLTATDAKDPVKDVINKRKSRNFMNEEKSPDYYVKLDHFYPVFPKPYSYYQDAACHGTFAGTAVTDTTATGSSSSSTHMLSEVTVHTKRKGLRKYDSSRPTIVIDAYEAFNLAADYGLNGGMHDWRTFSRQVAMALIGDMGLERKYFLQERFDGKPLNLKMNQPNRRTSSEAPVVPSVSLSPWVLKKYCFIRNLDKLYIYTDYAPREEGNRKYQQANQPDVIIDYRLNEGEGVRRTYRDRYYRLRGYAVCHDFYNPDYKQTPLPKTKDYRRTLYWNPNVELNQQGEALIRLYNNSKPTVLSIDTEGISGNGKPVVWTNTNKRQNQ